MPTPSHRRRSSLRFLQVEASHWSLKVSQNGLWNLQLGTRVLQCHPPTCLRSIAILMFRISLLLALSQFSYGHKREPIQLSIEAVLFHVSIQSIQTSLSLASRNQEEYHR